LIRSPLETTLFRVTDYASKASIILIGGLGTRLGALTADTPKPMLDVGGRPFLEYLLGEAARFGFSEVFLLAGYRAARVARYIEENALTASSWARSEVRYDLRDRKA
jgi:NDP-sugar pyrophosphorylase family protein